MQQFGSKALDRIRLELEIRHNVPQEALMDIMAREQDHVIDLRDSPGGADYL